VGDERRSGGEQVRGTEPLPDMQQAQAVQPPSERSQHTQQAFALARDGTRLFVRSRVGVHGAHAVRAILCDGIVCDGFIWKYLWDDLAPVAPLTHWHYRGHGRSAAPVDPDRIDIEAHADDLTRVRELVGNPPCVLIGHSMGCQVALENYRQNPEGVRGIVLICGSFGKVTETFHGVPVLQWVLPKLLDAVLKRPNVARALWTRIPSDVALKMALRWGEIDPERINPEDMLPYLRHMTHIDLPMFLRMLRAAGEHTAEDLLPEVNIPVLVVAGERDSFTPPFLAERMAREMPQAQLLMVRGGTHVASIEQADLVDGRIREFFETRVAR
jgi:pimeloyl-ACP methyl ester carboxylesterase